tara:strand:+ start:608 stop:1165 length:558 start_codon:yes stop_codon:yes gene_type:complete
MIDLKLIALDIDGILTSGKKSYDLSGNTRDKQFCDLDFSAIKIFKSLGIQVVCITGDQGNLWLNEKRNIETIVSRNSEGKLTSKLEILEAFCKGKNFFKENVWFVGDDIFDYDALEWAKYSSAPTNALPFVRDVCTVKIERESGSYFVSEMLSKYLEVNKIKLNYELIEKVKQLDLQEIASVDMS